MEQHAEPARGFNFSFDWSGNSKSISKDTKYTYAPPTYNGCGRGCPCDVAPRSLQALVRRDCKLAVLWCWAVLGHSSGMISALGRHALRGVRLHGAVGCAPGGVWICGRGRREGQHKLANADLVIDRMPRCWLGGSAGGGAWACSAVLSPWLHTYQVRSSHQAQRARRGAGSGLASASRRCGSTPCRRARRPRASSSTAARTGSPACPGTSASCARCSRGAAPPPPAASPFKDASRLVSVDAAAESRTRRTPCCLLNSSGLGTLGCFGRMWVWACKQ